MRIHTRILPAAFALALFASVSATLPVHSARKGGGGKPGGGGDANFAIAFVTDNAIQLTTIDGQNTIQLTSPKRKAGDLSPTWSPDLDPETTGYQGMITYLHRPDTSFIGADLMVMNSDGSNKRVVQSFPFTGDAQDPVPSDTTGGATLTWSPNGKEIVFSDFGSGRLIAVEVTTGNWRVLLDSDGAGVINDPTISPLNMLAFIFQGDIYAVAFDLDNDGLMQFDDSSLVNFTGDGFVVDDRHAVWSPDGTFLAIVTWTDTPDGTVSEVVVLDVLVDEEIVIWSGSIFDGMQGEPTWSPDGSEIAMEFVERSQSSVTVDLVRITNWDDPPNRRILSITQTRGTHEYEPAWNPGYVAL